MKKISYVNKLRLTMFILALLGVLVASLSSCTKKSYGCKSINKWDSAMY